MGGEWKFSFKYYNKESFDVPKYQKLLKKLRQEYEPQFSLMDSTEAVIEWTNVTDKNVPVNNVFAEFSYRCTKEHVFKGLGHGVWTLFWDPTRTTAKNDIHARCAPMFFKDLSNKIQMKLSEEFPDHFSVFWRNGLSGYEGYGPFTRQFETDVNDILKQMTVAMKWNDSNSPDSERCIHHIPWGYCSDCSDNILQMHGYS